ncbi:hypothetical protein CVT25_003053 [Psilocybe cyanescens]|uniref:Uncharacterized protein n=1 Tax=Psilocybe cyanescens TaxID=93625 RepID=A0A409WNB8_PSICY|nr:hypothetical protein CVT25_003053 [Psilocybe cyanescens]
MLSKAYKLTRAPSMSTCIPRNAKQNHSRTFEHQISMRRIDDVDWRLLNDDDNIPSTSISTSKKRSRKEGDASGEEGEE